MTINNWFENGCNYKEGVSLYAKLPNYNKNILKVFLHKENVQNLMKLKYELQKNIQPTNSLVNKHSKNALTTDVLAMVKKPVETKYFRKILLNQLPIALHAVYIQQKTDYNNYCSLKMQLNDLSSVKDKFGNVILDADGLPKLKQQTALDIEKARVLCLKIEMLFDAIDKTWQIIDHYLETKEVVFIRQKDFAELSPGKLRDKLVSVRSSITRQENRHKLLTDKLANAIAKEFKVKYARDLAKCTAKLMQLNQDKIKLIQLRDNEK